MRIQEMPEFACANTFDTTQHWKSDRKANISVIDFKRASRLFPLQA
ncbi:hypothetical protein H6G97_05195 [Nostoc flagelliforme FACHB-838]|uniref:Uncharacterized protein n=1 Tax=Nostoc flagelliforme FACHB-838 TaxID=2692904 RepID=A0ABR8DIA0_9NOSO|nr:hypothetical protein [Nostoc flagelliforme]MBD2528994.1 hypothetical protein [Nostoc flagelliforme FACHB-838]